MRAASPNSAKMDKYFCIAILFSFTVAINGGLLTGSGDSCTTECLDTKEVCYGSDMDSCFCPAGFKGDNCDEPNTDYIDEMCPLPDPIPKSCDAAINQCGTCASGTKCCSDGCILSCQPTFPSLPTCTSTTDCPGNEICHILEPSQNICMCPFGFTGDDCMEKPAGYDDRCPLPDDPVDLCDISETFDECFAGIPFSMCPDGKICCLRSDGCLFECISIDKKPPPKISKLALIAILMGLKNRPKQTVRRPPIVQVAPYAPYVQAAPHVPYIQAAPHVPFVQVAPAPVPVVQVAPAPVSITPSFTGAACGYGEALIHGCPDVCQSARCMIHDAVICRVHPCNGCTARWYNHQGHDVTASCGHVVG
ncbi:uncharacterized protein LOC120347562 [Styela clava]